MWQMSSVLSLVYERPLHFQCELRINCKYSSELRRLHGSKRDSFFLELYKVFLSTNHFIIEVVNIKQGLCDVSEDKVLSGNCTLRASLDSRRNVVVFLHSSCRPFLVLAQLVLKASHNIFTTVQACS